MKSKVFELQNNEREKFSTQSKTLDLLTRTQKTPTVSALGYCHKQHNGSVEVLGMIGTMYFGGLLCK